MRRTDQQERENKNEFSTTKQRNIKKDAISARKFLVLPSIATCGMRPS
jgi:hypothetical protein